MLYIEKKKTNKKKLFLNTPDQNQLTKLKQKHFKVEKS